VEGPAPVLRDRRSAGELVRRRNQADSHGERIQGSGTLRCAFQPLACRTKVRIFEGSLNLG
jgi:hypothetical protein